MKADREQTLQLKKQELEVLADFQKELCQSPRLVSLFLELTLRCNENCMHCGSRCGESKSEELSKETYFSLLDQVKKDFKILPMLCITGGEPLLRKDFFDILNYAKELGFPWGMTSNATLITKEVAQNLKMAGMKTVSVSIDGPREIHDTFRRTVGGYDKAMEGIRNLTNQQFQDVQITTVVTKYNIDHLDELFEEILKVDVDSWRLLGIEPIGRALDHPELMLSMDEHIRLLDFIREKRAQGYPVLYGCSHYLGLEYEREVRDWYFLCNAGVYTASVMANGDIGACLDIERRPETIQGNIKNDNLKDVWENRFEIFRTPNYLKSSKCAECEDAKFCRGGAYHSWDYDRNEQRVCFRKEEKE